MIDIKLVESFVLLMRSGSLTRAEATTGASKATLSRQISRLEEVLGVQLVHRSTRRITPTEAGRAFYARSEALLAELSAHLETAQTEVHDLAHGVAGTLSVLADTHFSTSFVCHVVKLFIERHPDVTCRLDVAGRSTSPAIDQVDCYVCSEPPDHPNLVGKLLGRLGFSLYASPAYLAQHGTPAQPAELAGHKAIELSEPLAGFPRRLHSKSGWFDFTPAAVFSTNDYWVMKTFCIEGIGIAMLPDFFTRPEVDTGVLQPLLPAWRPQPMRIYCAYQKQRYAGRKLAAFLELMAESFAHIDSFHTYVGGASRRAR